MKNKIEELSKKISDAQTAYYNGSEIMDDDTYDALVYELGCLDPNHPLLSKVGADGVDAWKKEKHLTPLGSLNKVNYPDEMSKWLNNTLKNQDVLVVEKLDGLSIGCQYENGRLVRGVCRGNGLEGEDIINNVRKMKGNVNFVSDNFTGTIRGEIVLTKTDHQKFFPEAANPRNGASGVCRRLTGEGCENLTLMFYQVIGNDDEFKTESSMFEFLEKNKFIVPNYKICKNAGEVNELWKQYQDTTRSSLNYEIDGLVVNCNDVEFQKSLGSTNLRPKSKLAFKFANQFVKTTVKEISWQSGNSGRITPVCWFEPVNLLGSTVEKASVYNIAYITELGLDVGAEVLICKANEIIPRVEKVINSTNTICPIPTECPECNSTLKMNGENLTCPNFNCPAQVKGRIKNWISELNILDFGETLIERLVENKKIQTVADIYALTIKDLMTVERMGEKSATTAYNNLWAYSTIPLETMLGALSIPMIGTSSLKLVVEAGYDTLEKIQAMTAADFEKIQGLGPVKAKSLVQGLQDYKEVIKQLLNNGVKIKEKTMGSLTGKSFCFTGSMLNKRADLEKMVENAGGSVKSVGKGLSYLVIADAENSTTTKAEKARKLGTTLISEEDFLSMVSK
jgi:DNA ligase (NAD+)